MKVRHVFFSGIFAMAPYVGVLMPFVAMDWLFFDEVSFHPMSESSSQVTGTYEPRATEPRERTPVSTGDVAEEAAADEPGIRSVRPDTVGKEESSGPLENGDSSESVPGPLTSEPGTDGPDSVKEPELAEAQEPRLEEEAVVGDELKLTMVVQDEVETVQNCVLTDPDQLKYEHHIEQLDETTWYVPRELVSYYATRPMKLKKLAGTYTVRGEDGTKEGFRVRPTTCSILLGGGFQANDVVQSINGRTVATVMDAAGAYLQMKNVEVFELRIHREGEVHFQTYYLESKSDYRASRRRQKAADREAEWSPRRRDRKERREERRERRRDNRGGSFSVVDAG